MQFVAARIVRGQVRRIESDGRPFLVVPSLAVQPGVYFSYENGREIRHLLPAETIRQAVSRWNGMPAALGHPMRNGRFVSARHPDVWESEVVGRLHNARMDGDRLRVDVYIDLEKAERIGGAAMELVRRVEAGDVGEVSVGFQGPMRQEIGSFEGQRYEGVMTDMQPDHLALLGPDETGQCSVEAGCGLNRVAQNLSRCQCGGNCQTKGGSNPMNETKRMALAAARITITALADISHDDIAQLLEAAMTDEMGDQMSFLIVDRRDDSFVYHPALPKQNGEFQGWDSATFFRRTYTIDDNRNVTLGDEEEVIRETTFRPVQMSAGGPEPNAQRTSVADVAKTFANTVMSYFRKGDSQMDRDKVITALSKSDKCPFDEEALKAFSDEQLAFMSKEEEPAAPATPATPAEPTDTNATLQALATEVKALSASLGTLDERIAQGVKATLESGTKADLIASLQEHTELTEDELKGLSVESLERMQRAVVPASYAGRPLPRTHGPAPKEAVQYDRSGVVLKRVEPPKTA